MPTPRPVGRRPRDVLAALLASPRTTVALVVAAAVAAAIIHYLVYPALSWNRDEPVYLWQAEMLSSGRLTASDGGFPELLHPWLSAWRDGEFFTQYPLGWPGVIFLTSLVGWTGGAISLAAALVVSGVCALALELTSDRRVANLAGLLFVISPIFAVQGGLYLNYLFTLGLGLWFVSLFLRGVRRRSVPNIVLAGALFGWIVCTRTFDAVLWGVLAAGYAAFVERGRWRQHVGLALWFIGSVLPFAVLQLLHNRALTGSALTFPISAKDPLDTFGFGYRRLMPSFEPEGYGLRRAITSTLKHGFFLPWFLMGTYLGVIVAAIAAWARRRDPVLWLLVAIVVAFPLGYFAFWGTYVSSLTVRLSGPIYFVPLYAPLVIIMAIGLIEMARRRPTTAISVVVVMAVITVPVTVGRVGLNRELSRGQIAWQTSVDEIDQPAVVVVASSAYLLFLNPFSANSPDVDGEVIFATNRWPSVIDLLDAHPDRSHYLQRATLPVEALLPSESPDRAEVVMTPLETVHAPAVDLRLRVTPPRNGERVMVLIEGAGLTRWRTLTFDSVAAEPIDISWTLTTSTGPELAEGDHLVVVPQGSLSLTVGVAFGSATRRTRLTPFVQQRFHLRTTDGVEILLPGVSARGWEEDGFRFPVRWEEVIETPEMLFVEAVPVP